MYNKGVHQLKINYAPNSLNILLPCGSRYYNCFNLNNKIIREVKGEIRDKSRGNVPSDCLNKIFIFSYMSRFTVQAGIWSPCGWKPFSSAT